MNDEDALNVSSTTKIGMPLRNLLAIVGTVAAGVLGYSELENRIGDIETSQTLMTASLESVSKWSDSLQTGETSTSATQELYLLLEVTSSQLDALEKRMIEGKAVSVNEKQELTLTYLISRVDALNADIESSSAKLEAKIENLRDKWAEMKAKNGVH